MGPVVQEMFDLPVLHNQQSFRDLVADDLQSRDDVSLEMAALLLRRETADAAATSAETQSEGAGALRQIDDDESNRNLNAKDIRPRSEIIRKRFQRWLLKRYCHPEACDQARPDMEAYIQHLCRRGASPEQPKVVYSYMRRRMIREILLFHLVPVSINFVLLGLYIRRVLWTPPWPTTNVLNALQFAAKIHETLMIASLASVLLHHIRHRLLSDCVPLGLVTSPFRLLDFTFLWSREFFAAWWSEEGSRRVTTIFVHVYLFVLAATLGPASAISMLPRSREWELVNAIAKGPIDGISLETYIGGQLSDIYPQKVTASFIPQACDYGNLSQPQTDSCPRLGLEDILHGYLGADVDNGWSTQGSSDPEGDSWEWTVGFNFTVQRNGNNGVRPRDAQVQFNSQLVGNRETVADATTSPDLISRFMQHLLAYYREFWISADRWASTDGFLPSIDWPAKLELYPGQVQPERSSASWKQPFTSTLCSAQRNKIDEPGVLSFAFSNCPESRDCGLYQQSIVRLDSKSLPTTFTNTGMGFVNVSNLEISLDFTPSAAFIYTQQSTNTKLCLIKAHWVDLTLAGFVSPKQFSNLIWKWQRPHPEWLHNGAAWFDETNPTQTIQLDLEWLAALDSGTSRNRQDSFLERLRQTCLVNPMENSTKTPGKKLSTVCMSVGLAAGITEGLSRVPYIFDIHMLLGFSPEELRDSPYVQTLSLWTDLDKFPPSPLNRIFDDNWTVSTLSSSEIRRTSTRLDFVVSEVLYGYGFHSITIILAFVVLFLYVATVLIHILIMVFGIRWTSRAWKSVGELLVLAMRSTPPSPDVLDNTGGGVESLSTWRSRVSVREIQDGKMVGMMVEETGQSGANNGLVSRVRADWKYS